MDFCQRCTEGFHHHCGDTSCRCKGKDHKDMDIMALPAGRQLDAIVAEKVMGWKKCEPSSSYDLPVTGVAFGLGDPPADHEGPVTFFSRRSPIPPFSTEIAAAWQIVDALRKTSFHNAGLNVYSSDEEFYGVQTWNKRTQRLNPGVYCESMPLAICRAALREVL